MALTFNLPSAIDSFQAV